MERLKKPGATGGGLEVRQGWGMVEKTSESSHEEPSLWCQTVWALSGRQWGTVEGSGKKVLFGEDLHCRKLTCWNLETKWERANVESRRMLLFSQWHLPLGTTFVWKLTKKTPLNTDPPWTWQTWGFSSQLEAITIRDAQWTPLNNSPDRLLSSGLLWEVQVPLQQGCLFWVVQLWWKGGLIQGKDSPVLRSISYFIKSQWPMSCLCCLGGFHFLQHVSPQESLTFHPPDLILIPWFSICLFFHCLLFEPIKPHPLKKNLCLFLVNVC